MLLAVDVGNTQTLFGLYDGPELTDHWRVATERHKSGDELGALYRSFIDLGRVDGISLSSTVPQLTRSYHEFAERYTHQAELLELGDAGAKLGGTLLEQAGDVAAGGDAVVAEGDDLADLAQREAHRLGGAHEPQAPQRGLVVGAIARWGPGRWGQDADLLVVADRLGRDPRLFGQLTDAHRHLPGTFSHHALDLPVYGKV